MATMLLLLMVTMVLGSAHGPAKPDVEIYMGNNRENGHKYIGQTKTHRSGRYFGTPGRVREHNSAALRNRHGDCTSLNNAIRKHGPSAFDWTVLRIVPADQGNAAEKAAIAQYNTFEDPQHYNLTPGGDMAEYMLTPAMREKQALTVRTHQQDRSIGISIKDNNVKQGYQVCDSATGTCHSFCSSDLTMDEKLSLAEACLKECKQAAASGTAPPAAKPPGYTKADLTLPRGVTQISKNGKTFLRFRQGNSNAPKVIQYFRQASRSGQLAAAKQFIAALDQAPAAKQSSSSTAGMHKD